MLLQTHTFHLKFTSPTTIFGKFCVMKIIRKELLQVCSVCKVLQRNPKFYKFLKQYLMSTKSLEASKSLGLFSSSYETFNSAVILSYFFILRHLLFKLANSCYMKQERNNAVSKHKHKRNTRNYQRIFLFVKIHH